MTDRQYVYKITEVVKVTDGDTFWLRCDVGFRQNILIKVRLFGYDCPEAHKGSEFEKAEAKRARSAAETWLTGWAPQDLWIRTEKDPDNFGRWLGEIWGVAGAATFNLGESLHSRALASIWPTRWHEEWDRP